MFRVKYKNLKDNSITYRQYTNMDMYQVRAIACKMLKQSLMWVSIEKLS
jgi:hypothetical protein